MLLIAERGVFDDCVEDVAGVKKLGIFICEIVTGAIHVFLEKIGQGLSVAKEVFFQHADLERALPALAAKIHLGLRGPGVLGSHEEIHFAARRGGFDDFGVFNERE